jgi:hypothetical protein
MKKEQWKPGHIVTLVGLLVAGVVLTPVAVGAATGQLVNIADGTDATHTAKVSSGGALKVGDGSGPVHRLNCIIPLVYLSKIHIFLVMIPVS